VNRAAIGLGANLGDPSATIRAARAALRRVGHVRAVSSLYRTAAWGVTDQPAFVNAVLTLETALDPFALLAVLKEIERELGRIPGVRWGPRAIDLDILAMDGVTVDDPALSVPHARLRERAFALVPLAEIDPAWIAARDALPVRELEAVERIGPFESEEVPQ
jgi:2-amino-4-hydroxy-6-hydroxymethyldihydropteridine diphosphokinase